MACLPARSRAQLTNAVSYLQTVTQTGFSNTSLGQKVQEMLPERLATALDLDLHAIQYINNLADSVCPSI